MNKLGRKSQFEKGTLMAFACNCRCSCYCLSCSNCNTVPNATGLQLMNTVNDNNLYNKSFGPLTILS